jgi:F0F1-type ATP synthase assembly protein I
MNDYELGYSAHDLLMMHKTAKRQAKETAFYLSLAIIVAVAVAVGVVAGMIVAYRTDRSAFWLLVGLVVGPTTLWYGVYRHLTRKLDMEYAAKLMVCK